MISKTQEKRIKTLERRKQIYLEFGRPEKVQMITNTIRAINNNNCKDKSLIETVEHQEKDLLIKHYYKTCDICGNPNPSPRKTTRQICIYCKLKNGSYVEAKKDFELLAQSTLTLKKNGRKTN